MKKLLKSLIVGIGLVLVVTGGYFVAVGFAYSKDYARTAEFQVPYGNSVKRQAVRLISPKLKKQINYRKTGLLYPLVGGGGIIALLGFIFILNGIFRLNPDKHAYKRETRSSTISDNLLQDSAKTSASASNAPATAIDDSLLDPEDDSFVDLRNIKNLVTLNQGFINPEDCQRILKMFRSDLLEFVPKFNEDAVEQLSHRVLESIIMRERRQIKEITADQFKVQDRRLNEIERETFARRYMPLASKVTSPRMQEIVGRAYDLIGQSKLQKEFLGEAEDWVDVSLRNAKDVMSAKTTLE